jgi:hypothetical protein
MASIAVEKSIIIAIRMHGQIGVTWSGPDDNPDVPIGELIRYVDNKPQLEELRIVSTSNIGDKCWGNPDMNSMLQNLKMFTNTRDYDMNQFIQNVLIDPSDTIPESLKGDGSKNPLRITRPTHPLKWYIDRFITDSKRPTSTLIIDKSINKVYTPLIGENAELGGIFLIHTHNISKTDITLINTKLTQLMGVLIQRGHIFRHEIYDIIDGLDINKFTLCDFTCDVFVPTRNSKPIQQGRPYITQPMGDWLIKPESNIGKSIKRRKPRKGKTKGKKRGRTRRKKGKTRRRKSMGKQEVKRGKTYRR